MGAPRDQRIQTVPLRMHRCPSVTLPCWFAPGMRFLLDTTVSEASASPSSAKQRPWRVNGCGTCGWTS